MIPKEFDEIRPWEPEDFPEVFARLCADNGFRSLVGRMYPQVPFEAVRQKLYSCKTNLDFQLAFVYPFIEGLMSKASLGYDIDINNISADGNYTFISNHRDIVMDSALLDMLLVKAHFKSTCEIAIGDNLLSHQWVKDLARLNKAFIVERGLPMRQLLMASKRLSDYMHYAASQLHDNIWIAQREGRAKDSDDRTQEAILKMMTMGGSGSIVDRLVELHLVPTAISYEFDPCDFLKAREFQLKRDISGWKKGPEDDMQSMQTGIMGFKGHVHYHCAPCLDNWLRGLDDTMPKAELYRVVTEHIDHEIHAHYRLYPNNYIALDELHHSDDYAEHYTEDDKARFDKYIAGQLAKIELDNPDTAYLRERMLTMYANPAVNFMSAK